MKIITLSSLLPSRLLLVLGLSLPSAAFGVTTFVENFDAGASNWRDAGGFNPLAWNAEGGPGGIGDGHVTTTFSFQNSAEGNAAVMFRGHDGYNLALDRVGVTVPEPAGAALVSLASFLCLRRRRSPARS